MRITLLPGLALSVLAGCSMITKTSTAGGSTTSDGGEAFADNMHDAPLYHAGATIDAPAACASAHFAKFDIPAGEPFQMDVSVDGPAGACLSVSYLRGTGGTVDGMMKELCVDKNPHETWDVEGQDGGSYLQVLEEGPCKGASISVALH